MEDPRYKLVTLIILHQGIQLVEKESWFKTICQRIKRYIAIYSLLQIDMY